MAAEHNEQPAAQNFETESLMLAVTDRTELQKNDDLAPLESLMLKMPQVECPVVHHFGPGIYIREVTIPAGTLAVGHHQKFDHLNILLAGAVAMIGDDGSVRVARAPLIFTGKPGRKFGYAIETTVWQNIYATQETDIETLESTFIDKSQSWQESDASLKLAQFDLRQEDRDDFHQVIARAGFSPELVRQQSEELSDQLGNESLSGSCVTIRPSPIEGLGVFVSTPIDAHQIIAAARINGMRTPVGRYANHSKTPNAVFVKTSSGDVLLVASRRIAGCTGGDCGEEVTVDYRQGLALSGINLLQGVAA